MKDGTATNDPVGPAVGPEIDPPSGGIGPAAVRQQLEQILASPHFRHSRRYPAFLRYVVERTLDGAASELKERNIAVDVFARDPSYDPSVDPIVRITAGEVRKRLAQYYQQPGREAEIRIEMPLGSYLPEFGLPAVPAAIPPPPAPGPMVARRWGSSRWLAVCLAAGLLVLSATVVSRPWRRPSALEQFWHPVVTPRGNVVLVCIGGAGPRPQAAASGGIGARLQVPWGDAVTLARLAGLIQAQGASFDLVSEDRATFEDFQRAPAVLIGAFNDAWTLRLMEKMRFTFHAEGLRTWIVDRDHPTRRDWQIDLNRTDSQGRLQLKEDFAVISRVENPRTRRITITVAGLYGYGTLAAGKFLTDPANLQAMAQRAPAGWQARNMQIVIRTEVIQDDAGPPIVVATAFW
ncbi:MAG: hypothetical protein ABSC93_16685 [Bryobacteraceae bacterium]|jgi:hypothetical protein